jgi:hypothetical protein
MGLRGIAVDFYGFLIQATDFRSGIPIGKRRSIAPLDDGRTPMCAHSAPKRALTLPERTLTMMHVVLPLLGVAAFVVLAAYVSLCDRA